MSAHPLSTFSRLLRSDVMRWLAVVVLAPMMAVGAFGGGQFLVHGHDDQGTHWHRVSPLKDIVFAPAENADDHGHDLAVSPSDCTDLCDRHEGGEEPCEVPEGTVVSFDVHKQLPTRGAALGKSVFPGVLFMVAIFAIPPSTELDRHVGSPIGTASGGPLDLVGLSASDRLVRTSRALLI